MNDYDEMDERAQRIAARHRAKEREERERRGEFETLEDKQDDLPADPENCS